MYNEALQEILTKIEERAPEVRAFCPGCGHMCLFEYDVDEDYVCNSCSICYGFLPTDEPPSIPVLINYNKMRFEHVTT